MGKNQRKKSTCKQVFSLVGIESEINLLELRAVVHKHKDIN